MFLRCEIFPPIGEAPHTAHRWIFPSTSDMTILAKPFSPLASLFWLRLRRLAYAATRTWGAIEWFCATAALALQAGSALASFAAIVTTSAVIGSALDGDRASAWRLAGIAIALYVTVGVAQVLAANVGEHARLRLRSCLVQHLHGRYFQSRFPYWVLQSGTEPRSGTRADENSGAASFGADQRLTTDVDDLAAALAALLFGLYQSPSSAAVGTVVSTIVSTSYVSMAVSPAVLGVVAAYVAAATIVATLLVVPRSRAYCDARSTQGALRQAYADVVDAAEPISWWAGHAAEAARLESLLHTYRRSALALAAWEWGDAAWSGFMAGYPWILSYAVVAVVIAAYGPGAFLPPTADASGHEAEVAALEPLDATRLSVGVSSIAALISAVSLLPSLWSQLSELGGFVHRVAAFDDVLDTLVSQARQSDALALPIASAPTAANPALSVSRAHMSLSVGGVLATTNGCVDGVAGGPANSHSEFPSGCTVVGSGHPHVPPDAAAGGGGMHGDIELVSTRYSPSASSAGARTNAHALLASSPPSHDVSEGISVTVMSQGRGRVWLRGPSGSGKTSSELCVAGLRPCIVDGQTRWLSTRLPGDAASVREGVMFLPQDTYVPFGDPVDIVRYPRLPAVAAAAAVTAAVPTMPHAFATPRRATPQPLAIDTELLDRSTRGAEGDSDQLIHYALLHSLRKVAESCDMNAALLDSVLSRLSNALSQKASCCMAAPGTRLILQRFVSGVEARGKEEASVDIERRRACDALRASGLDGLAAACRASPGAKSLTLGALSRGQQQRLGIARALYHHPPVLWLDESINGLDDDAQRQCLQTLSAAGISFVVASHRASVRELCESVCDIGKSLPLDSMAGGAACRPLSPRQSIRDAASESPMQEHSVVMSATVRDAGQFDSREATTSESQTTPLLATPEHATPPLSLSLRSAWNCVRLLYLGFVASPPPRRPNSFSDVQRTRAGSPCCARGRVSCLRRCSSNVDWDQALAWIFAALAVAIAVIMSRITVLVAFLPGRIFAALQEQDLHGAMAAFAAATAWYIASPALGAGARQLGKAAGIQWYAVIVRRATAAYLREPPLSSAATMAPGCGVLYALHFDSKRGLGDTRDPSLVAPSSIDRPDQHVAADAALATKALATILFGSDTRLSLLQVLLTIGTTAVAASEFSSLAVLACFAYTFASLLVTRSASLGIPAATAAVAAMEGALRAVHTSLVRNAAAVGLLRGEPYERLVADAAFAGVLAARTHAVSIQFAARLWNNICAQSGTAIAYTLTLAVVWQWGHATSGTPASAIVVFGVSGVLISLNLYLCAVRLRCCELRWHPYLTRTLLRFPS